MSKVAHMERLDRIKHAIDNEDDTALTDAERTMKVELLTTLSMVLNPNKSTTGILKILKEEHNLSERDAYKRMSDARFMFGNLMTMDRALEKVKAYQRAEKAYMMAKKQKYVDGMVKANEQMMKIVGTDDPNDMIDPTKLEPSMYVASLPPSDRKIMKALLDKGVLDLGELMSRAGLLTDAVVMEEKEGQADTAE